MHKVVFLWFVIKKQTLAKHLFNPLKYIPFVFTCNRNKC